VRHSLPSAAAIVLPGGAFQRKESWGPLKSLLADTFSVVTVDLPGWGEADLLPESYGIDFLTDSLQVLLRFAGHHAVHLFGGSYGSAIAYRYVQKYPCAVHSPVFAGTITKITAEISAALRYSLELRPQLPEHGQDVRT
ncbi:MAG TPA: alpha/beta fold hydrolase, partial [Streptosporangiaceae bacterium]